MSLTGQIVTQGAWHWLAVFTFSVARSELFVVSRLFGIKSVRSNLDVLVYDNF